MAKVTKFDDKIQFRISKEDKKKAERLLLEENRSLADFFREKIMELLKKGK